VLRSRLDTRSEDYRANLAAMEALWGQVEAQLAALPTIGGQRYVDRHRKRGKMLVRERIEALVDPDTPFLELMPLAPRRPMTRSARGWPAASASSRGSSA